MKFIHAVVLTEEEVKNGYYDTGDWGNLTDGDYVVHCLYSVDNEEVVILEDNTHAPVEEYIENFIEGVEYTGAEAYVDKAFVVMNSKEDPYCVEDVEAHFKNGNYGEVM